MKFLFFQFILINADINGVNNILKKIFPNAISADEIDDVRAHPYPLSYFHTDKGLKDRSDILVKQCITLVQ